MRRKHTKRNFSSLLFLKLGAVSKRYQLTEDTESWKKHIDHMTLTVESKRRQSGGAACVATVEWMKKAYTLRICTQTRNFSDFFISCFLSLLPVWYGSNSSRKMSKVQLFVVGEMLNSCGKLWYCKVVTQFLQPPYCALSAFIVFLLMLNWKKSFFLLGIKFCGHAKEEAKQQPAMWMRTF